MYYIEYFQLDCCASMYMLLEIFMYVYPKMYYIIHNILYGNYKKHFNQLNSRNQSKDPNENFTIECTI